MNRSINILHTPFDIRAEFHRGGLPMGRYSVTYYEGTARTDSIDNVSAGDVARAVRYLLAGETLVAVCLTEQGGATAHGSAEQEARWTGEVAS